MKRTYGSITALLLGLTFLAGTTGGVGAHPHPELLETDLMPYPFWSEPVADDIYHVPTGTKISFDGMMDVLSSGRLVFVGETHNNIHAHRIQLEIIEDLYRRFPGKVAIGMEMFREPQQASLDRWVGGELSEAGFLKDSKWFENWSSDFGYYREVMNFARENGIDIIALNPAMELQRAVGMSSLEKLPPEIVDRLPEMDSSDPFQQAMVRAVYGAHEGGEKMQEAFLRVQLLWEETMAERIVQYLDGERGEGKVMVVIAGGAHVQYGYGIPKKVLRRRPMPYYIVLPEAISAPQKIPEGEQIYMHIDAPEIPLLSGDFIWTVPYDLLDSKDVRLGIMMASGEEGISVEKVLEDSPASIAGIMPGDLLVSIDNLVVEGFADVLLVIKSKSVGDTVTMVVRRSGRELTLSARFTEPAG